jgi:ketosteroid isomerase-like protein
MYGAFNARDIEAVLATFAADVDWPNAMENTRVHGHAAVRDYWTHQWDLFDPRVDPTAFETLPDGDIAVRVHQVVKDLDGNVLSDQIVQHAYRFKDGLVARMEIAGPEWLA